ncbi:hypothetical protein H4582DRAFT_680826 [Lactarius indigo]|nr:hypothetical protein H4582DRAFT_680826 [Lactarius indigo]
MRRSVANGMATHLCRTSISGFKFPIPILLTRPYSQPVSPPYDSLHTVLRVGSSSLKNHGIKTRPVSCTVIYDLFDISDLNPPFRYPYVSGQHRFHVVYPLVMRTLLQDYFARLQCPMPRSTSRSPPLPSPDIRRADWAALSPSWTWPAPTCPSYLPSCVCLKCPRAYQQTSSCSAPAPPSKRAPPAPAPAFHNSPTQSAHAPPPPPTQHVIVTTSQTS